jgi:hypothetical protein
MPVGGVTSGLSGTLGGGVQQNPFGIDPGAKDYASQSYSAMTRSQWAQYVSTFVPIENQLIQYATDPTVANKAMANASMDVNRAFDAQEGATQRRLRGMGVTPTAEEQTDIKRQTGLARSLADVQGQNIARELTTQRQQSIIGNPAPQGSV